MDIRRRRRGFERAGHLPLNQSGLPVTRARALRLVHAWRQVAGEIVARNVPAVSMRRGSLELAPRDAVWCRTLIPMVEVLGLRLARQFPELGVRKIMVVAPGNETVTVVLPREAPGEAAGEQARSPRPLAAEAPVQAPTETVDLDARLRTVRRRYLERAANRPAGVKTRNGS